MAEWDQLDALLDELDLIMPAEQFISFYKWERNDWRPCWDLVAKISDGFRGIRYPSKTERDQALQRFRALRSEANRRAEKERTNFFDQSERLCKGILNQCRSLKWSRLSDAIFFFDKTNADDVRRMRDTLREVKEEYKTIEEYLVREHRNECWQRFEEIAENHREFWEQYHGHQKEQQKQWNADKREKIMAHIGRNTEKLEKAKGARDRVQTNLDDTRAKLDETRSEKWTQIFEQRIEEAENTLASIDESIARFTRFIEEDEEKLRNLE